MHRVGFNRRCSECSLSCQNAVTGQSVVPLNEVVLIVISAYPGSNEIKQNISLAKGKSLTNAGSFLRHSLNSFFDDLTDYKPIEDYIYFTNIIKCSPQKKGEPVTITPNHLKTCKSKWLDLELASLPKCPILIASSEACFALLGTKLNDSRNRVYTVEGRKAVVTYNPIEWERGAIKKIPDLDRVESELDLVIPKVSKDSPIPAKIAKSTFWRPPPLGSALWFVHKDLQLLKPLVNKYVENVRQSSKSIQT